MKKNILIISVIIFLFFVAIVGLFLYNQKSNNFPKITEISDKQIISLLSEKSADAKDYMKNHTDFKIEKKEILTKESILAGQKALNFKEVYLSLALENNRYMKVDLINQSGDRGLISIIDFKEKSVPIAYLTILFSGSENGQTNSKK